MLSFENEYTDVPKEQERINKEKDKLKQQQRGILHELNAYITKEPIDRNNIDLFIKRVSLPDKVILRFLIYLMQDKFQCYSRHAQNKMIGYAFTKMLIDEDITWNKLRETFLGKWSPFDISTEKEKQACRAAAAAYCAYTFTCPHHLKTASFHSVFEIESEDRQSYELLKILQNEF